MTKTYYPFDAGDGDVVTEAEWATMARLWHATGVVAGELDRLEVSADGTDLTVDVAAGVAWIRGFYFRSTAIETLTIAEADPFEARIDRIVVRLDRAANTVDLAVLEGTAEPGPTPPSLTQDDNTWEAELATVDVPAAASAITGGNVTDARTIVAVPLFEGDVSPTDGQVPTYRDGILTPETLPEPDDPVVDDPGNVLGATIGANAGNLAVHPDAYADGGGTVAAGYLAQALSQGAVAIGQVAEAGTASTVYRGSIAIGDNTTASQSNGVAIGRGATSLNADECVLGGKYLTDDWNVPGDFTVAGVKDFEIDHPLDPNQRIQHGAYEGPVRGGLIYEGTIEAIDGEVRAALPDYVPHIGRRFRAHATPERLAMVAARYDEDANELVVEADRAVTVHWQVTGERDDPAVQGVIAGARDAGINHRGKARARVVRDELDDGTIIERIYRRERDATGRVTSRNEEQDTPTTIDDECYVGARVLEPGEDGRVTRLSRDQAPRAETASRLRDRARAATERETDERRDTRTGR